MFFPYRTLLKNPKRGGQVILMWRAHGFKVLLQESSNALPYPYLGPYFIRGSTQKIGSSFLWPNGHRSVRPTRLGPSGLVFCSYPLQFESDMVKNNAIIDSDISKI